MKTTAIIPTFSSPLSCFVRSLCSLIATSGSALDQIIVSINGPDERTGDVELQDEKFKFCQALQEEYDLPVTVLRSWSRIGFANPIQMALPLVRTDTYLLMHDDVLVLDNKWEEEAEFWLGKDDVDGIVTLPVFETKMLTRLTGVGQKNVSPVHKLYFPSLSTVFAVYKKSANLSWAQYTFEFKELISTVQVAEFFSAYPKACTLLPGDTPDRKIPNDIFGMYSYLFGEGDNSFKTDPRLEFFRRKKWGKYRKLDLSRTDTSNRKWRCVSTIGKATHFIYELGAWASYEVMSKNHKIAHFSKVIHHLEKMSSKRSAAWECENPDLCTRTVIDNIKRGSLKKVYSTFVPEVIPSPTFEGIRPLVCVQVYDRVADIENWIETWHKSMKFGGKLLIMQNYDETEKSRQVTEAVKKLKPDYHWMRKNDNQLLGIFELLEGKFEIDYDWNVMCFFIDDIWPLRKDFLYPLLYQFEENKKLGLTGGWKKAQAFKNNNVKNNYGFRQRDVVLAFRKEALIKVNQNLTEEIKKRGDFSHYFEYKIGEWIIDAGYRWSSTEYEYPFIFAWDVDNNIAENLFEKGYANLENYTSNIYEWNKE